MERKRKITIQMNLDKMRVIDLQDTLEDFRNTHNIGYSLTIETD